MCDPQASPSSKRAEIRSQYVLSAFGNERYFNKMEPNIVHFLLFEQTEVERLQYFFLHNKVKLIFFYYGIIISIINV